YKTVRVHTVGHQAAIKCVSALLSSKDSAGNYYVEIPDVDQTPPASVYEPPLNETEEIWLDVEVATAKRFVKDNWIKKIPREG
ncbi:hypothetical protein LCGC14_3082020, partial [marine sediment metagenome]